jgi:hypothetical protein
MPRATRWGGGPHLVTTTPSVSLTAPHTAISGLRRIDLSPRGTAKEMMERIFENKNTIINMLALDRTTILNAPTDAGELVEDEEDDPLTCSVCASGDATAANPIIKCDGEHETEVGVHLGCMDPPLDSLPEDEWFCKECQKKSLYQVEAIVDKRDKMKRLRNGQRTGKPCVHYKVKWAGAQWEGHDTSSRAAERSLPGKRHRWRRSAKRRSSLPRRTTWRPECRPRCSHRTWVYPGTGTRWGTVRCRQRANDAPATSRTMRGQMVPSREQTQPKLMRAKHTSQRTDKVIGMETSIEARAAISIPTANSSVKSPLAQPLLKRGISFL